MLFWRSLFLVFRKTLETSIPDWIYKLQVNWSLFRQKNCGRQSICVVRDCRWDVGSILALNSQVCFKLYFKKVSGGERKEQSVPSCGRTYVLENMYTAACWTGWRGSRCSVKEPSSCCLQHSLASFPLIVSHNDVHIIYFYYFFLVFTTTLSSYIT